MSHLQLVKPSRLDVKACVNALRDELKNAYPGIKFSVRRPRGGTTVYLEWTDGPSCDSVSTITKKYESSGFDGMTDSSYVKETGVVVDGETFRSSIGYIFETRNISAVVMAEMICKIFDDGYDGMDHDVEAAARNVANGTPIYIAAQHHRLKRV